MNWKYLQSLEKSDSDFEIKLDFWSLMGESGFA